MLKSVFRVLSKQSARPVKMFSLGSSVLSRLASPSALATNARLLHVSALDLAARKGTREKARKAKVKKVVEKVGFIRHDMRNKGK